MTSLLAILAFAIACLVCTPGMAKQPIALEQNGDAYFVRHEGRKYRYVPPFKVAGADTLALGGKLASDLYGPLAGSIGFSPGRGDRLARECILQNETFLYALGLSSTHGTYACQAPNSADGFEIALARSERLKIENALAKLGGAASEQGLFGRRGSIIVLGRVEYFGVWVSRRPYLFVETWFPVGTVNDPATVAIEFGAAFLASATLVKELQAAGLVSLAR